MYLTKQAKHLILNIYLPEENVTQTVQVKTLLLEHLDSILGKLNVLITLYDTHICRISVKLISCLYMIWSSKHTLFEKNIQFCIIHLQQINKQWSETAANKQHPSLITQFLCMWQPPKQIEMSGG